MLQSLLSGIAATLILLLVWLQVPSLDSIWHFSDEIRMLFGEAYRLLWLILAFLLMAFAAG